MTDRFVIKAENPESEDAFQLLRELSRKLALITGNSGKASFNFADVSVPRSLFVIARNKNNEAVGCGAIRRISGEIAEVKRMYAKRETKGVGTAILNHLERQAFESGYRHLRLETRRVNEYAVNFYLRRGFAPIPNYGKYIERPDAVCLGKILTK
jgi:ribosomal protein S18 acetylase RimI-like enzyme